MVCGNYLLMVASLDGLSEEVNSRIRGKNSFLRSLLGMYELTEFDRILWGVNYVSCQGNLGLIQQERPVGRL